MSGRQTPECLGGGPVIRRMDARDARAVEAMAERCGPATMERRFLGPRYEPGRFLADQIRYQDPAGRADIGAFAGPGRLVGFVSLVPDPVAVGASDVCQGGVWELAMLVEDVWQHRHLGGTLLAAAFAYAAELGITELELSYRYDGSRSIRALLLAAGCRVLRSTIGAGVVEARIGLPGVRP